MHIRNRYVSVMALCLGLNLGQRWNLSAMSFASQDSDGQSLHGKIVREALSSTLNASNVDLIVRSLDAAKLSDAGSGQADLFGGKSLGRAITYVDRQQKKVLNFAADADVSPASRYRCLKNFGELLSVAQDFYSRSNYVELEAERMAAKAGKGGFDPYSIELVDWNKLNSAVKQNLPLACAPAVQAKETADQGKSALATTTYYKAARELAVRETSRQWELLETLVKRKYRDRSVTILAALKQASCPATEPDDAD